MRHFPLYSYVAAGVLLVAGLSAFAQTDPAGTAQPAADEGLSNSAQQAPTPAPAADTPQASSPPTSASATSSEAQQPAVTAPPNTETPATVAPATSGAAQAPAAQNQPTADTPQPASSAAPSTTTQESAEADSEGDADAGAITEDEVKSLLVGKTLYLRGGYLDNSLGFDEHGKLVGHSPQGSYTLNLLQIDRVHLSKHKVELTGLRYGLHFLGARPDEDPTKAVDKVRITPKKKVVKITIDRELVVKPKKKKHKKGDDADPKGGTESSAPVDADEAKAEMNAAPAAEGPADSASVTTTTSPAHAAKMLRDAIDQIFAPGLDDRMIAAMPTFWKLYYDAVAKQADYKPADPSIYRQGGVDRKAKLLSAIEAPSNEFAQASGVAGMALYHAVIGADGKPQEIVVGRPIGFGLDESAADTIRKASFEPAMKDGKPVPVVLDLVVQFRIYSKRTNQPAKPDNEAENSGPKLPGPYSVMHP